MRMLLLIASFLIAVQGNLYPIDHYEWPVCAKYNGYYKYFENMIALLSEVRQTGVYWSPVNSADCKHPRDSCTYDYNPVCGYANGYFYTFPNLCLMHVEAQLSGIYWGLMFLEPCELHGFVSQYEYEASEYVPNMEDSAVFEHIFKEANVTSNEFDSTFYESDNAKASLNIISMENRATVIPVSSTDNSSESSANKHVSMKTKTNASMTADGGSPATENNNATSSKSNISESSAIGSSNARPNLVDSSATQLSKSDEEAENSSNSANENFEDEEGTFVKSDFIDLEFNEVSTKKPKTTEPGTNQPLPTMSNSAGSSPIESDSSKSNSPQPAYTKSVTSIPATTVSLTFGSSSIKSTSPTVMSTKSIYIEPHVKATTSFVSDSETSPTNHSPANSFQISCTKSKSNQTNSISSPTESSSIEYPISSEKASAIEGSTVMPLPPYGMPAILPLNGSKPNISASTAHVHLQSHNTYNAPYVEGNYINQPIYNYFGIPFLQRMANYSVPYDAISETMQINPLQFIISIMEQIIFYLRGL